MNSKSENTINKITNNSFYQFKKRFESRQRYIVFPAAIAILVWLILPGKYVATSYIVIGLLVVIICVFKTLFKVIEESVLVLPAIGIQLDTVYLVGHRTTKFIPWSKIEDVVVNEAVAGFRMVHYLAVYTSDGNNGQLIPILLKSKLPLAEIKEIYCDIQAILD